MPSARRPVTARSRFNLARAGSASLTDLPCAASLDTVIQLLSGLNYLPPEVPKSSLGEQRWRVQRLLTEMVYDPTRTYGLGWNLKQMRRVVRPKRTLPFCSGPAEFAEIYLYGAKVEAPFTGLPFGQTCRCQRWIGIDSAGKRVGV